MFHLYSESSWLDEEGTHVKVFILKSGDKILICCFMVPHVFIADSFSQYTAWHKVDRMSQGNSGPCSVINHVMSLIYLNLSFLVCEMEKKK